MTRIETREQYEWAVSRVETLLPLVGEEALPADPDFIELELLSNLVADYSDEHFSIGTPSLADVLQLRLYELGLTQKQMGELLGVSSSRINDYLKKRCEPTLAVARLMYKKLNIPASVVLG